MGGYKLKTEDKKKVEIKLSVLYKQLVLVKAVCRRIWRETDKFFYFISFTSIRIEILTEQIPIYECLLLLFVTLVNQTGWVNVCLLSSCERYNEEFVEIGFGL